MIDINLSACGVALWCDYFLTPRLNPDNIIKQINSFTNKIKNNDKLYIEYEFVKNNIHTITDIIQKNNIKINIFIIVEPVIPTNIIEQLLPYCYDIFILNNTYNHKNVHNLPIGIRDGEEILPQYHKGFTQKYLINEGLKEVGKTILCLLCFTTQNNAPDRKICETILKNKNFILNLNNNTYSEPLVNFCGKVPLKINYEFTHKSIYVLSPRGYGVATHRFFEAIYLNSIPIVKKTNTSFDKMYEKCPCLIVNNWEDITYELLKDKQDELQLKLKSFKYDFPNFFTDLDSIFDLLKQM